MSTIVNMQEYFEKNARFWDLPKIKFFATGVGFLLELFEQHFFETLSLDFIQEQASHFELVLTNFSSQRVQEIETVLKAYLNYFISPTPNYWKVYNRNLAAEYKKQSLIQLDFKPYRSSYESLLLNNPLDLQACTCLRRH